MKDAMRYLEAARETYLERYRAAIRKHREEGVECVPEVWVRANPGAGEDGPRDDEGPGVEALCIDILCGEGEKQGIVMVSEAETPEGPPAGALRVGGREARVYPICWEACLVWFRHPSPDWGVVEAWQEKWADPEREVLGEDPDGLHGCVHYVGRPGLEGGGYVFEVDFGSAPVEALTELLGALAESGATELELGRSDGTDLDEDVAREVDSPELTPERLAELVAVLIGRLPEVEAAERVGPEAIAVKPVEGGEHTAYTTNLFLRLQRVGLEARRREVWRFVRGQRDVFCDTGAPDLSRLRPVIKDDRFVNRFPRKEGEAGPPMLARRLTGDLWVCCVWDSAHGMRYVMNDEPGQYGLDEAQMHERALANYLEARGAVEVEEHRGLFRAQTGDDYDASLLLDARFWEEQAGKVRGELLACVPARNVVLFGGTEGAGVVESMRRVAEKVAEAGDHLVSGTIVVRREGEWRVYAEEGGAKAVEGRAEERRKKPWWRFW